MSQLDLIPGLVPSLDPSQGQWWTPPRLAERIATSFPIAGRVIEPTAGAGNLVAALERNTKAKLIYANELDPRWVARLEERWPGDDFECPVVVDEGNDFLADGWRGGFDWCVMNPPDESKKGIHVVDFLVRAMELADEVVALVRLNAMTTVKRTEKCWRHAHVRRLVMLANRPEFGESGGEQEWCVVWYGSEPRVEPRPIQWWEGRWS